MSEEAHLKHTTRLEWKPLGRWRLRRQACGQSWLARGGTASHNPSFAHGLLNCLSASGNTDWRFQNRKIRARMVQHKHRVVRQGMKSQACADEDFVV